MNDQQNVSQVSDRPAVESFLREFMAKALPTAPGDEDIHIPFLEMGANSLVLMEVQRAVESRYGLTIAIPQFFQELTTMDELANYIVQNQVAPPAAAPAAPMPQPAAVAPVAPPPVRYAPESSGVASGELESILVRQIESASRAINQVVAQQLQFLGGIGLNPAATPQASVAPTPPPAQPAAPAAAPEKKAAAAPASKPGSATVMHRILSPLEIRARGLSEKQSRHLEALIGRYTARTRISKELAARYRSALADSRAAVGFRFTTKEMLYPIVGTRGQGANVWDVDGNKYIDITMGQGVTLFGHHPKFIDDALADPENDILMLGPRSPHAGEAAALFCEMTGMERVTFTNTGTEAVMAALRLARTATQRTKIVMFDNAYHGHADNVMGRPVWQDEQLISVPVAPGITQGSVDDLWLLDYGSDAALDFIRAHAHELAAVIVEPVQSRRPDLQPREFLHELRRITEQAGALLIFDEMITGFRVHQGGAQAWFGVKADIATYGKVLAGGMPIGVVAGAARLMDAIDGGMWNYGDASYPVVDRTIFGGTFCQHPTAMITMLATLRHLKEQGPALQEGLNRRTETLAAELNDFFDAEDVPIRVVHFGSLFRFAFSSNLELLFYHLMEKGVFIWEWRNYFLSTAHTDADVAHIVQALKECVAEMRAGGFLPERSAPPEAAPPFPLSEAQRQLSILAQITPEGSIAYHVSPLLRLSGHLEVAALRIAVREVMRRHEALRTVIVGDQQQVMPLEKLPDAGLTFNDLSAHDAPETALAAALEEHACHPFDLARGPLFEAHLFRLAPNEHRLLLKAHHIVVDGLSVNLIVQDLAALYTAALHGLDAKLPTPLQLKDYLGWRASTSFPQQEAYWLKQLSGDLPVLDLPVDRPEPQIKTYQGGRYSQAVPPSLLNAVRALSRAQGCTHFMTLFSAYALWLHRLCAQEELLVGMPVAGRNLKGGEQLVAYCTHLIPIRSRMTWNQTFAEYLRGMRDTLLQGYQNQDYPFAELINHPSLKAKRGNLVSALFNLDRPGVAPEMAGLKVDWLSQPIHRTAFALTLNLTEVDDAMVLECDFSRDLFDETSIARYVGHFLTLLQGIVANPNETLARLPLLDAAAGQQLLVDWNDTAADYPRASCAHQLFEAQAAQTPQAGALRYLDAEMSYAELNAAANRLAAWLRTQSVGPEAVVGLCMERSPELVIGLLAIMKAGGAYLPLDPSYPAARLDFMLADAGVAVLLTQERLKARLNPPAGVRVLCLDTQREAYAGLPDANPISGVTPENLAYLIYTSGSTGQPKGTLIAHRGLVNYLSWAVQRYEVAQGEGAPLHSSISFDATITSLFAPLITGRRLTILPEGGQEIDHIRAALQSGQNWSLVKLTPAHLELINAMIPSEQLAGLTRFVVLGGEALLERHVAPWCEHAPETRLINEYGPTETVVGCCIYEVGTGPASQSGSVPIGRPIANTQLYVLDANRQPVPVGVKGELYIGGEGVARGYHRRPELTNERFVALEQTGLAALVPPGGNLYRTGDVVRYLPDGNLVYLGRIDNQVKVRGFRIELGEIESVLAHLPGVREAVVVAHRRSDQDVRLIAYVAPVAGVTLDERILRQSLSEVLPAHMLPSAFVLLPTLPLTGNGKVDRAALPLPDGLRPQLGSAYADPGSEAEKRIAAIWRELLEVERVGVDDNFFELGGHSLLVIPLRDRLQAL
ncbi:MAG: amino acid adenylation domain-containing protein, partial [Sulfuricellaceae bacterium]